MVIYVYNFYSVKVERTKHLYSLTGGIHKVVLDLNQVNLALLTPLARRQPTLSLTDTRGFTRWQLLQIKI
jgi:hypothetical protein